MNQKNPTSPAYGPDNPHPLSTMRTELVWEGKYDEYGNRREVDLGGCSMPMQRIETIDQPRSEAAAAGQLDLFEKKTKRVDDFRNRLIWGDNKLVMASLLKEYKGKIDLIYIDPPFDVGADFTMKIPIGDEKATLQKEQSTLEMVAYRDMWGKGTDSYIYMMYERLVLMRDMLSERGVIYVHCDYRVNFLLRSILDEVFSSSFFLNENVWSYGAGGNPKEFFPRKHDTILSYSKAGKSILNKSQLIMRVPYDESTLKTHYKHFDDQGRRFRVQTKAGRDYITYAEDGKLVTDVWTDIGAQNATSPISPESTGYASQKPEKLLQRIIEGTTNQDYLVADFFCGSGTTGAVAERLGRRWIMADLGRFAIHTSRKRLIELQRTLHTSGDPYRAFDVYNLGRYERQWWHKKEFLTENSDAEHRQVVLEFFRAEVLSPGSTPSPLLHGRKSAGYCHVDGIDSIFTRIEARAVASAVQAAGGKECYCLAWEFEMDLHHTISALKAELGVRLKLVRIPREIMEKNRTSPPPFLEMAVLKATPRMGKPHEKGQLKPVDIELTDFIPSFAEVPTKELEAIRERAMKNGFDFIDFWAIDFDWTPGTKDTPNKPFNHHWQDYRTRKDRSLLTTSDAGFIYPKKGTYTCCVKVIDTFGCDTSITIEVKV